MKMKWRLVFGIGLTAAVLGHGSQVFAQASEQPVSSQTSQAAGIAGEVIETETGIYYTVKKGDTLWDLSRKFSNSPYRWPNLWSENRQIANPHRIYPGERIRLYRRDGVEPSGPVAEETVAAAAARQPVAAPPTPAEMLNFARIERVGFIREVPVAASGRIFKVRGSHKMITTDDIVYLSPENDHNLRLGQRYTIYRTMGPVRHIATGEDLGIQHYILGTVEVIQTEPEYAIGRVVKAFGNIKKEDLLMPYKRRSPQLTKLTPPPGIKGEVIMAEEHNKIIGDNVTAFIDKGENDGIKPGQTFSVYYQDSERIRPQQAEKTVLKPVSFGELVVLHTEATTSTVYITQTKQAIVPGSRFSSPEL